MNLSRTPLLSIKAFASDPDVVVGTPTFTSELSLTLYTTEYIKTRVCQMLLDFYVNIVRLYWYSFIFFIKSGGHYNNKTGRYDSHKAEKKFKKIFIKVLRHMHIVPKLNKKLDISSFLFFILNSF